MKKLLVLVFVLFSLNSFAQLNSVGELIRGGVEDGQKLMMSYLYPYEKALGYTVIDNSKIYTESEDYFKLHLAFGLKVNSIFIPNQDLSFDVNSLNLSRMEPANSNLHISPTVFGDTTSISMKSKDEFHPPFQPSNATATFNTPQGINFHLLPIPELQFAASYLHTQVISSGYYVPYKNITLWGYNITLNNQISSIFSLLKDFPVQFDVSVGFGSSSQKVELDVKPDANFELFAKGPYDNQKFLLTLSGFSFGVGATYKISKFTIYSNMFYQHFDSRTQVLGNYPVNVKDPSGTFGATIQDVIDPIDYSRSIGGLKVNFGTQYDIFKHMYLKADYALSSYHSMSLALGYKL